MKRYVFVLFIFFSAFSNGQEIFSKCYNSCGVFNLKEFNFDDIVFDSGNLYSYILFSVPGKTHFCKIDSLGNNILLREYNNGVDSNQVNADTTLVTQVVPLRLLRIDDNLILLISLKDSSVLTTSGTSTVSMLLISFYDSSLIKIKDRNYLLPFEIIFPLDLINQNNPVMVALSSDQSKFNIAMPYGGFSGSSVMLSEFDTTGNIIKVVNFYEPGYNFELCDYKLGSAGSFMLIKSDSSAGLVKIDTSLAVIKASLFNSSGDILNPLLINTFGTNDIMFIATRGQDQPVVISLVDSGLNIINSHLLLNDSIYNLTNVIGRDSRGLMLINLKHFSSGNIRISQDVVFIDTANQIHSALSRQRDNYFNGDYYSVADFGKIVERNIGYESLRIVGSYDHHFGDHYDLTLAQLGRNLETCYELDSLESNYFLGSCNLTSSLTSIQDSLIILPSISSTFEFVSSPNIFNYTLCTELIDGIEAISGKENLFQIFPNPTSGIVTISNEESDIKLIEMYNCLSQKIFFKKPDCKISTINIESFPSGIYYVKAFSDGIIFNAKVIKE